METRNRAGMAALASIMALGWAPAAHAACESAVLARLLDRGFSHDEIMAVCGGPAAGPANGQPTATQEPTPTPPPNTTQTFPPPPPAGGATQEAKQQPPELVGTWSGRMEQSGWAVRLNLRPDGAYVFYIEGAPGIFTNQPGHWWVEGGMIAMRPDSVTAGITRIPLPPQTEFHPYEFNAGANTLIIRGGNGEAMRMSRG